jgi:two-component system OmpR family sensor kinase
MNDLALPINVPAAPEALVQHAEFLAALSHELRTPLAAIKGFTQMLVAHWDSLPETKRRQQAESVLRSTLRLERLVQDLSLAVRLADGIPLLTGAVDLQTAVADALEEAHILYPARTFHRDSMAAPVTAFADRDRAVQVVANLLDNAARYAPAGTPISIGCWADATSAHLEVSDMGVGFTSEEQALLFRRLSRLGTSRHGTCTGGSGLGLFICKQLVEAMGGHIGVRVGEHGIGNTFWFTLPIPPAVID